MYRTIFDIIRFNTFATDLLDMEETDELRAMSISTYLDQYGYSQDFRDNYLIVHSLGMELIVAYDCSDMVHCTKFMFFELSGIDIDAIYA